MNQNIRIAILGPESSGKTTLSQSLSKHFNARSSQEYAREYLTTTDGQYEIEDLDIIAKHQFESNNESSGCPILIADTEMLTIKIWSEVKYQKVSSTILDLLEKQQFDLYLLCKPDLPWEEDPLREHPEYRDELFQLYEANLKKINAPFKIISGDKRFDSAVNFIQNIF